MTRKSQNYFKHQICQDEQFRGIRYSLTFRAVHWRYWNSNCIVGGWNTENLMFGTERGTFGVATPGEKFFSPTLWDPQLKKLIRIIVLGITILSLCVG